MDIAHIIERVKGIIVSPKTEWEKIAAEPADVRSLYVNYAIILAAIPAVCGLLGSTLVGVSLPMVGTIRTPIAHALVQMVLTYVLGLAIIYAVSLIVNALAPTFDGKKDPVQALKLVVYSSTPVWLAGALSLIPMLGMLGIIAGLYGLYVLYLGLTPLMKNPQEKSVGYTALVIVSYLVLALVMGAIVATVAGTGMAMRGRF
jgi:hypothetical protein